MKNMMHYKEKSGRPLWAIPATYQLNGPSGKKKFREVLFDQGGLSKPWVLKVPNLNRGQGITMLGPNTKALKNVLDKVEKDEKNRYIIQEYICNTMTIEEFRFEFRIYWLVASVNPLIVLWHPGSIRIIKNQKNDDIMKNWNSTKAHLGNLHQSGTASSWDNFAKHLEMEKSKSSDLKKRIHMNAMDHVENQVKHSMAEVVDAFKDISFNRYDAETKKNVSTENLFAFYCADFMINKDMDIFLIEPQMGCGMSEDEEFKSKLNMQLTEGMAEIVGIVADRQERALPISNNMLKHAGGSLYEVIYNDGWMFEYDGYEPVARKGCDV